jgi:hypothetical protein
MQHNSTRSDQFNETLQIEKNLPCKECHRLVQHELSQSPVESALFATKQAAACGTGNLRVRLPCNIYSP